MTIPTRICLFALVASSLLLVSTPSFAEKRVSYFAGGCFWCTEADFEKLPGVFEVISGFMGGKEPNPSYEMVASGATGHRETVAVHYDNAIVSYADLINAFWRIHDPSDPDGSFVDRGFQYSSAIYYADESERLAAIASRDALDASGRYDRPIATAIEPKGPFYAAEDYHQDYYKKNQFKYTYYRYRSGRDEHILEKWPEKDTSSGTP